MFYKATMEKILLFIYLIMINKKQNILLIYFNLY